MGRRLSTQATATATISPAVHETITAPRRRTRGTGLGLALAACVVGLLFAAVSVYWGAGGTRLLDTVAVSLERQARAGETGIFVALWAAVVLKIAAAVLPVLALRRMALTTRDRIVSVLAWTAATFLTVYGLLQTAVAQLLSADVIHAPATVDDRRLAWQAFVWDPWFLIWGLLAVAALLHGRRRRDQAPAHA